MASNNPDRPDRTDVAEQTWGEPTASIPNEATPLLHSESTTQQSTPAEAQDVPLPMGQIALLSFGRVCETLSFFVILPFVNQMIADTGAVPTVDVGFWSGLIESLFSLVQMFLMIPYGWLSDAYGRKPVLVFSLFGIGVASSLFGLSRSVWQMIAFRMLAGASAGTVVTMRTMFSEISSKKTEARAFSLFAFAGNIGIFVGPLLGGVLSKPAENLPAIFGHVQFLHDFPYFLPTFVAGLLSITAGCLNGLFLKETLVTRASGVKPPPRQSTLSLLRSPRILYTLLIYSHALLLGLAFTAVAPLLWFTPISLSGFGFTPLQISFFLGSAGVSQALWLLLAFPWLQHRIGTDGVLRLCGIWWPLSLASNIGLNMLLRHGHTTVFWALAPVVLVVSSGTSMSFTGVQLALNAVAPTPAVLGTLNGIALSLACGIRAFAPAAFSSLFAVGVGRQILGGYLAFTVMTVLAAFHTAEVWWPVIRGKNERDSLNEAVTERHEDA